MQSWTFINRSHLDHIQHTCGWHPQKTFISKLDPPTLAHTAHDIQPPHWRVRSRRPNMMSFLASKLASCLFVTRALCVWNRRGKSGKDLANTYNPTEWLAVQYKYRYKCMYKYRYKCKYSASANTSTVYPSCAGTSAYRCKCNYSKYNASAFTSEKSCPLCRTHFSPIFLTAVNVNPISTNQCTCPHQICFGYVERFAIAPSTGVARRHTASARVAGLVEGRFTLHLWAACTN